MASNSLALMVRSPNINIPGAFAAASKLRQNEAAIEGTRAQTRLSDFRMNRAQNAQNSLEAYNTSRREGNPQAIEELSGQPEMMAQMLKIRSGMRTDQRSIYDAKMLQGARDAQRILAIPAGEERESAYQTELKKDLNAGDIDQQQYQQLSGLGAQDSILKQAVMAALPLEKQIELERGPKPTTSMRNAQYAANLDVNNPAQKRQYEYLTKPRTQIKLPEGEKSFAKKRGATIAERVTGVEDDLTNSQDLLDQYEQITELLSDPSVYTGTGGDVIAALKKAGSTLFGAEIEGVANSEVARKTGDMAVAAIKKAMNDPRMSDSDRKFYRAIPPNIGDSPEGIQLLREMQRQNTRFKIESQDKMYQFLDLYPDNKTKAWSEFSRWRNKQNRWSPDLVAKSKALAKGRTKKRTPRAGIEDLIKHYGLE